MYPPKTKIDKKLIIPVYGTISFLNKKEIKYTDKVSTKVLLSSLINVPVKQRSSISNLSFLFNA